MQMMREFGTTDPAKMRYEQYGGFAGGVGDGGGSSYGQVSARNGWDRFDLNKRIKDARRSASQQEAIPWNQDLMDRIVARTNTPEAIADRERETQQFDAASRARDEYASSERGQAEIDRRVSAENASRQQRGLPPLNAAAENRLRRSVIADGGRRDQRAAERDARMGLPPVGTPQPQSAPSSEEPYQPATLSTGRPANPANPFGPQVSTPEDRPQPAGTGNTTSVGGGFSIPGQAIPERPFDNNQGYFRGEPYYDGSRRRGRVPDGPEWSEEEERVTEIRDRIDKYNEDPNRGKFGVSGNTTPSWISTPVASALNSRGFRPANPIMNRLRPGGMIA